MKREFPGVRSFTRSLIEWRVEERDQECHQAAEWLLEELSERMTPLIGRAGYHLLLSRALKKAKEKHPVLAAVRVERNGKTYLSGMDALRKEEEEGEGESDEGAAETLLSEFIALTARFLGADMAIRLVRQSFPDAPPLRMRPDSEESTDE